jgi:hypothetical protein
MKHNKLAKPHGFDAPGGWREPASHGAFQDIVVLENL